MPQNADSPRPRPSQSRGRAADAASQLGAIGRCPVPASAARRLDRSAFGPQPLRGSAPCLDRRRVRRRSGWSSRRSPRAWPAGTRPSSRPSRPVLGTAHPTGYPSYVILGWLASHLSSSRSATRPSAMNLLQAILAAGAVAGAVAIVQFLTGMRWVALAIGLLL